MFGAHPMFRIGGGGYQIANSLRFRASNSAYLSRTFGSPTSSSIWTFSTWCKRGSLGATSYLLGASTTTNFGFNASNQLVLTLNGVTACTSTAVFRDPSAWMHIVYQQNGSAQTIYVNNASVATGTTAAAIFNTAIAHQVGAANTTNFFDGHLANVYWIDGQALTPSSFGQTEATTGVWVPKAYSGTYGTNGFFLQFKDAASTTTIGYDTSGNSNNFTTSGISVTSGTTFDQMTDTPTNNYPVWSPIDKGTVTVSEANMAAVPAADTHAIRATVGLPATGKWYWEIAVSALGYGTVLGIADNASNTTTGPSSAATRTYNFGSWFNSFNGGVVQYGTNQTITGAVNWTAASQPAANDIIMVAVDMDNGSMWVGKNGTWFNSSGTANPATNTDPRWTGLTGTTWFPYMAGYGTASPVTCRANFGQRAFSYTPPSGFKALNTANLSVPTIKKPSLYMDATLRTGTGATASVSSLGFQPDLVWIKSRSAATSHNLFDSSRGATKGLVPDTTAGEYTDANSLTAFSSNGYSLGSDASSRGVNINTNTYVDWAWKKGVTPGFDIVEYAGDNTSNRNINHSLGVTPAFAIIRNKGATGSWFVWHKDLTGAAYYLRLENENAQSNSTTPFGTGNWSSTQFMVTNNATYNLNANSNNYVAYLFAEVAGFSRFGSYVGNAAADGPFAFCNFSPRFLMLKNATTGVTNWALKDTARSARNDADAALRANSAVAEATGESLDILSNGFKVRNINSTYNSSGGTIVFAAFAESPFKYARAR